MNFNVVIVEDELKEREKMKEYISRFGKETGDVFTIFEYSDGLSFLDDYKFENDIVFMDIKMPYIDGMETARRLRNLDDKVVLVFVTNMAQFAVSGYEVDASGFVVKPFSYVNFSMKLERAVEKVKNNGKRYIMVKGRNSLRKVRYDDIRYVEVMNHSLVWHTRNGVERSTGSLKSLSDEFGDGFAFCNSCYLVNLKYCEEVVGYTVVVDGEKLQISRPKRASFLKALNLFVNDSTN